MAAIPGLEEKAIKIVIEWSAIADSIRVGTLAEKIGVSVEVAFMLAHESKALSLTAIDCSAHTRVRPNLRWMCREWAKANAEKK